jgi:uncharacterized protein YbaR (Trm112 family)
MNVDTIADPSMVRFARGLGSRNPSLGEVRERGAAPSEISQGDHAMIDDELRAILACPACKGNLIFEETRIICPACKKAYPVRDGIPVMLIDEAEPWAGAK